MIHMTANPTPVDPTALRERLDAAIEMIRQLRAQIVALSRPEEGTLPHYPGYKFSRTETLMLVTLSRNAGQIMSKQRLWTALSHKPWETTRAAMIETKALDVVMCRLRKRLKAMPAVTIETIWGQGYTMSPASAEALAALEYSNMVARH